MVLFVGTKRFETKLAQVLRLLAEDSNWRVRRTVACGFHEVSIYCFSLYLHVLYNVCTCKYMEHCITIFKRFQTLVGETSFNFKCIIIIIHKQY